MKKLKEKKIAQELRKEGYSLSDIVKKLHVSKSTASIWCKEVNLSSAVQKELNSRTTEKSLAGLKKYSEKIKNQKKASLISDAMIGSTTLGTLSQRDIYCIGLGLYWGEGYKSGSQEFGFTNSDPQMIIFYITWLEKVFSVKIYDLILRISINQSHQNREKCINRYWSEITKVPLSQFTKISFIKSISKKQYVNSETYMGTLRVKVKKGTVKRRYVIGAIKSISV